MTKLEKPMSRIVEVAGAEVVVTLVPEDGGIQPHIKFRLKGNHKAYRSQYIELPPVEGELYMRSGSRAGKTEEGR
ncbi:MAG: hypothetical protein ACT4PE_05690 [Candidatus Eiseniibacteriota bacterium]